ncbi:hypothetical protein, variant 3 [Aphanomyces invadans]|uniref:DNA 3'-5' helicase n=1 Tax=Aphanomyces invadans TaxID=157072 RepID=A0A024TZF3_9STRA|nr:hypothetical protein, variant 2 [Aphanomyces invadans]XP_008872940.1 hypothetical protein, variant 3 [Aphanomyces invadans]ETV98742.1 hypothetical protein, variant 2 [Aphanomyces invadans]ETV98743.1 hypothetical protein, variant 3 [Aphanomyces invadans]|eukprot:XP_008872939.1 hypothetical protein, variant 2 [Aphanomyces invadans]
MVRHLAKWDAPAFPWSTVARKVLIALSPTSQAFRPCQEAAVNLALSGFSLFLQLPTGAGKTVCFQLPSLLQQRDLNKVTLVVSPLRSLLTDQKQRLTRLGLAHRAVFLSPGTVPTLDEPLSNDVALLYATPELLLQNSKAARLLTDLAAADRLARVVLDEAHCVLEWGNSFRPTYLEFARHCRHRLPHLPVTFVTATASPEIVSSTANLFGLDLAPLPDPHIPSSQANASTLVVLQHMLDRTNLRLQVLPKTKAVLAHMASLLKRGEPAIVYVLSQKDAESVATGLMAFGLQAQPYHAGMSNPARKRAQQLWMSGKVSIICATVAFGMGIDRADVRHVIHHSLPMSLSSYMQQIGRAGSVLHLPTARWKVMPPCRTGWAAGNMHAILHKRRSRPCGVRNERRGRIPRRVGVTRHAGCRGNGNVHGLPPTHPSLAFWQQHGDLGRWRVLPELQLRRAHAKRRR